MAAKDRRLMYDGTIMITFLFGGGRSEPEAEPLIGYYERKIKRMGPMEILAVGSKEKTPERIKEEESRKITDSIKPDDYVIIFDERGKELSSEAYADVIEKAGSYRRTVIVVGGAYGADQSIRDSAKKIIAFSPMIFPHQLSRIMALEQTYRAISINRGSKYHHV